MCSVSPWRVGQTCSTGFTTPREIWGWPVSCFKNISLFQIMMIHLCACRRLFHLHGHPWVVLRHEPYPWCPLWRVLQGDYHYHHHQCCHLKYVCCSIFSYFSSTRRERNRSLVAISKRCAQNNKWTRTCKDIRSFKSQHGQ